MLEIQISTNRVKSYEWKTKICQFFLIIWSSMRDKWLTFFTIFWASKLGRSYRMYLTEAVVLHFSYSGKPTAFHTETNSFVLTFSASNMTDSLSMNQNILTTSKHLNNENISTNNIIFSNLSYLKCKCSRSKCKGDVM